MYDEGEGITVKISRDNFLLSYIADLKSGANQAAAGALAGEPWVDTDDDNTIKRGV